MRNKKLGHLYSDQFYSGHRDGMARSATEILALLYKLYKPASVVDMGCGQGAWLAVAESLGSKTLKGYDGVWVNVERLASKNIDFTPVDFNNKIPSVEHKYDLCISLEVAEHINESNATKFVDMLCNTSDVVLFSAATKYQGGTNHVNEQWPSYWVSLFNKKGFCLFDVFRSRIWDNESVEWWYRQNVLLFVRSGVQYLDFYGLEETRKESMLNIIHPTGYELIIGKYKKIIMQPTLRFCVGCIKRYLINKFKFLRERNIS